MSISQNLEFVKSTIPSGVTLVAISKTHSPNSILEAYNAGQKIFGENKVQEMVSKYEVLPKDIEWHLVGHLQTNKVKFVAPFVNLIHSVDSLKLLQEINKEAIKNKRIVSCLLQIHIAEEETKFGLSEEEVTQLLMSAKFSGMRNIQILGLMGMATFTDNVEQVRKEFRGLAHLFKKIKENFFANSSTFQIISMGMSSDYTIAVEEGSTMIRVGSSIFGERFYSSN
jgi:hypothetical protein